MNDLMFYALIAGIPLLLLLLVCIALMSKLTYLDADGADCEVVQ